MQNYNEDEQVEDDQYLKQKYEDYFKAGGDEIMDNLPGMDDEGSDSSGTFDNSSPQTNRLL
jgi:hypothetical protein